MPWAHEMFQDLRQEVIKQIAKDYAKAVDELMKETPDVTDTSDRS